MLEKSPLTQRIWTLHKSCVCGVLEIFPNIVLLFAGKETDSDDDAAVPSFAKLLPSFSLDELKHLNQYTELKPAYDCLYSGGINTRDLTHSLCFDSIHPEAHIQYYIQLSKRSDERSLQVLFDTCSSLDLIVEDIAKQCIFPLRKSEKLYFVWPEVNE